MDTHERINRIRLSRTPQIGPVTCQLLIARYKTASKAIDAVAELSAKGGRRITPVFRQIVEQEIEANEKLGASFLIWGDPDYPSHLARFSDAPFVLSAIGHKHLVNKPGLGIVGARNASMNACKLAHSYARQIGNGGYTIISGLARGIDKASHEGSLATGTIAVLANGLDHIYPADHEELFNQIAQQGLILSERALGTKPNARLFPARNRLIASLSRAVLIVEAARNSGSMITAREAADRGVDVLAIPGSPLDPRSAGCNQLIKDGAYLVQSVDDIFAHIENQGTLGTTETGDYTPNIEMDTEISSQQIDELKDKLLECLSHDPISVDELARFCHVSAGMINAVILELELSGSIQRHYGNKVSRVIDMPQSID